jgi:zinc protease
VLQGKQEKLMINTKKATKKSEVKSLTKVSERKNIAEYRLENGLKILLVENHVAPVVTVLVLFKVGSRNEAVGHTGATHFLEHMLFKGTKKHNAQKGNGIDDLLTQIGAYWNATTWFDRTSYFEVVPSEYLELCIDLEADRMRNLLLRQEDHDSEMSVVRNEMERGENYPEEALEKELYAVAFREHPYHHPTIGWRSDVEGVPMERLKKFYDTFYWPNNATVVVVGDFEKEQALNTIEKYYGKIPIASEPIPQVYTVEPPQEGERRFQIRRAGDLPRVWIGYHVPEANHPDNYPLAAIRHLLGGTYERSSRLYKSLIDSGIAADSFARHHDLKDPGLFIIGATLNPGVDLQTAESILHAELAKLASDPVTEEELGRAKSANIKGTILAKAEPSSLAFMLGEAEAKADWHWLIDYDDKFNAVTAKDILRVASQYFVQDNRTVGHFIPKPQQIVAASLDRGAVAVASPSKVGASGNATSEEKDKEKLKKLLEGNPPVVKAKVPKPKPHTSNFAGKVVKQVLPNGLTLLLMENPGTESVAVSGICRAGKYFSYSKNSNLADLAVELLPKGSLNYGKLEMAEILEAMGIPSGLDFSIDNFRVSFGTHLVAKDLPLFLTLLADVLCYPGFDQDELQKTKVEWKAKIIEAMNSTRMLAWNGLRRNIYGNEHPFFEKSFEEELAELDDVSLPAIRELHTSFMVPQATIITIVGDINIEETIELVSTSFGDWQGGPSGVITVPPAVLPQAKRRVEIKMADKKSVDIVMGHPTALKRTDSDFYAAKIANAALGQDTITSRLGQVVRDRAGLTYGIYSSFSDSAFGQAPWSVTLSVNPVNVDKAVDLATEVLSDYLENGISEDELSKETGRAIGSFKVGLASSSGIARVLSEFEFLGLGPGELDKITSRYLSVTKAQADAAMRKYMRPDRAITVVAGTLT